MNTEDQVIVEHTKDWFADSSWSIERFATELLVPKLESAGLMRSEEILSTDHLLSWRKKKAVQVGRVMKGTTQFPLAWKWFWLQCLPESYRESCEKDLLAMAGKLDVPLPSAQYPAQPGTIANIAKVVQEFSEFIATSKPAQDGRYDQDDDPEEVNQFIDEAVDVVSALLREIATIEAGTGCTGSRNKLSNVVQLLADPMPPQL